jgi:predicted DsbA family dithiol-disulfide isomerase
MSEKIAITVHFDLICPWCLIGKRHLRSAVDQFRGLHPSVELSIEWRSQLLLPDTPLEGIPYKAFYERRLGGPAAVAVRRAQVREAARVAGVELAFERIEFMPNTLSAHLLIDCARNFGDSRTTEGLIERLFTAYFMEGRNIGDPAVLASIAAHAGFPEAAIKDCLTSPDRRRNFIEALAGRKDQANGVPFFVFNDRLAISGAQQPPSLLAAMEQALQPAPVMQAT